MGEGPAGGTLRSRRPERDLRQFYDLLARFSGRPAPALHLPKSALLAAATTLKALFGVIGREAPIDPEYIQAIVGNFSWYDSSRAAVELGYRVRPIEDTLREAVRLARQRLAGSYPLNLVTQGVSEPAPTAPTPGRLLITGVPGWLGNRWWTCWPTATAPAAAARRARCGFSCIPRPGDAGFTRALRDRLRRHHDAAAVARRWKAWRP